MNKGKILWQDLTVENAEQVRDFYCEVIGWNYEKVTVNDYDDFNMIHPETKEVVAGICHKKGSNKALPSQWLNYVLVQDIEKSIERCIALNGIVVEGPRNMGKSKFAVIRDPAGAYFALMQE